MEKLTYISLFSSAGVGCFGFKSENFQCVATNELIERRLNIQKANNKCKYNTGYICGDITADETKKTLYNEINMWKKQEKIKDVTVLIATPPCQGMSVANHKKKNEIKRNSLVIESISIVKKVEPIFFVFENVSAFMKTICTDLDGIEKPIGEAININLSEKYSIASTIINFKDHGSCSSRTRTIVIGIRRDYSKKISPIDLFPKTKKESTLYETIGKMPEMNVYGDISKTDIYHFFRAYPEHMRAWIKGLKEGESAFDNEDKSKIPNRVINGKIVYNKRKNADKYTRQYWNKVAPCIHTRNDLLASQNTIHPRDDRVFSIRELMKIMTIPTSFKWSKIDENELNSLTFEEKKKFLKKEEINIRQSIGEAVPTAIFTSIAQNIQQKLNEIELNTSKIKKIIEEEKLDEVSNLKKFISKKDNIYSFSTLARISELANAKRTENEAYYTNASLLNYIYETLPTFSKKSLKILEPSVGVGNFIPILLKKYENIDEVNIDVIDIDKNNLEILKILIKKLNIPKNFKIKYIHKDYLKYNEEIRYDLVIGNPPFAKLNGKDKNLDIYKSNSINFELTNTAGFFIEKAINNAEQVCMIMPKYFLNTEEYKLTRNYINSFSINDIIDFGENGFEGVLVETIYLNIVTNKKPSTTNIHSITLNKKILQKQTYITDNYYPYWLIYRNDYFDIIAKKMKFNVFTCFRDRQITNGITKNIKNKIWVIKSRNIDDTGSNILHCNTYDSYIDFKNAKNLSVYKYIDKENIYLTPNMTYKPRMAILPKNSLVNGSVAILIPKYDFKLSEKQRLYFSTTEYREFYKIARNYATRSLNIDKLSVFFFGILGGE